MSNPRAAIGLERRRQIQIRKAFEAGLALQDADRADLTELFPPMTRKLTTALRF
jgi:hypothetical protein